MDPAVEQSRVEALKRYGVLDSARELAFDDVVELVAAICQVPIAAISLVDTDRQWFKAIVGLDASETPRDVAFCAWTITQPDVFVVEDAHADQRFADNPLVTGDPSIRFYAGAPLMTPDGHALGALCAADRQPRVLTAPQRAALAVLARHVVGMLELARAPQEARKLAEAVEVQRRAASEAGIAKSAFLANMSHELRTPMNAVVGIVELLRVRRLDADTHELIEIIGKSGDALVTILDDVLDLAKIEAGRLIVESTSYEPRGVVEELLALLGAQARGKGVAVSAHFDEDVPRHVLGDRKRVRQVLMNLAGNALKFTAAGSVSIKALRAPQDRLRFEVTDTGIGIGAEDLSRLFLPFVQVDLSTTKRFGGTGLGLAISKHLAELMGGAVGARSEVGKGSTFWFTVHAPTQVSPLESAVPAVAAAAEGRAPLRILLAEDNEVNRQITVRMLERLGYHADLVPNGLEALAALSSKPYDVVLMDVHMPEMDGLEATRQVRGWARPQPWIIAITAAALPSDSAACFAAGANAYLPKPVKLEALDQALRQVSSLSPRAGRGSG